MCMGYLHVCLCTICLPGALGGQKMASDSLERELMGGCEPAYRCWDLNPDPLEEQPDFKELHK